MNDLIREIPCPQMNDKLGVRIYIQFNAGLSENHTRNRNKVGTYIIINAEVYETGKWEPTGRHRRR